MSEICGRFSWFELLTSDVVAAQRFYTETFHWSTKTVDPGTGPYTMFVKGDGEPVSGLFTLSDEMKGVPPHWTSYIGSTDVDADLATIEKLGGAVLVPASDVPTIGRFAVAADPHGASFSLLCPSDPPDASPTEPSVGEFSWCELKSGDWAAAWRFYERLFGWQKTTSHDMGPMGSYQLFSVGGIEMGGMFTKPDTMPAPPHWLYYTRVQSVEETIERARIGGAQLLNGPMVVPTGDTVAQLLDPQGAAFALHQRKA